MNAILSSDYTVALSGRLRADAMLNMLIAHGVTPDMFMSEMSFKGIDSLISKYTGASLAFKLMQIPKQATSFIGGFQQYRFGDKPNPVKDLIMFSFDYAVLVPQMMLEALIFANMICKHQVEGHAESREGERRDRAHLPGARRHND